MISIFSTLYFWAPDSDDLLYVTELELYSLTGILRRMNTGSELQTKPPKPLPQHSLSTQPVYYSLWFWEVPEGWSQSLSELRYLQEFVLGCYEYGLPLSIPILVCDGRSGSTEFLMKCGEEYYLFYETSSDLVYIEEPTGFHDILCVLGTELYVDLKTTHVNPLPEYCGPKVIADDDLPESWSNKISEVSCGQEFFEHGIFGSIVLLFYDGGLDGTRLYLVAVKAEVGLCF